MMLGQNKAIRTSFLFLVITLSFNSLCFARDFVKFNELSEAEQAEFKNTEKAVFKFDATGKNRCTATYISNEGHAITAHHCMKSKCLPIKGVKKWTVFEDSKLPYANVTAYVNEYPSTCTALIDGVEREIEVLYGAKGELLEKNPAQAFKIFKGPGLAPSSDDVQKFANTWKAAFLDGWGYGADFAIFKVKGLSPSNVDCVPLDTKNNSTEFGKAYLLSYPGYLPGEDTLNEELVLSTGVVASAKKYFKSEIFMISGHDGRYLKGDLIIYPSSSGASLINPNNGRIQGVLSVGIPGRSSGFIGIKKIKEVVGAGLDQITCREPGEEVFSMAGYSL